MPFSPIDPADAGGPPAAGGPLGPAQYPGIVRWAARAHAVLGEIQRQPAAAPFPAEVDDLLDDWDELGLALDDDDDQELDPGAA